MIIYFNKKMNKKKFQNIKLNKKENKLNSALLLLAFIIYFLNSLLIKQSKCNLRKINQESIITIEINITGSQHILYEDFKPLPDEVLINEKRNEIISINNLYKLEDNHSIIIIKWKNKIYSCDKMFYNLQNITKIDLSKFDSSLVNNTNEMFFSCESLISINFNNFKTSNIISMISMFENCISIKSLNLSNFNTSSVKYMDLMFFNDHSLISLNIENFNTLSVVYMNGMFYGCESLRSLDLSNFNTSHVSSMSFMFTNCHSLTSLNIINFNTSLVIDMRYMFSNNYSLKSLNLSNFNTSLVTNMDCMFISLHSLTYLDLYNFNTSSVEGMSYIFYNCKTLTFLNIINFNTTLVKNMEYMFYNCYSLTSLNIINFNTTFVYNMRYMFYNCSSLTSLNIYNFDLITLTNVEKMFYNSNKTLLYCINEQKALKIISELKATNNNYINYCKNNPIELEGYYLDINIYKPCYINCKNCNRSGSENDNKCIECKLNYIFKKNLYNNTNCYEKCLYYFYFDSNNNHFCTLKEECPKEQNKLIIEKRKCIDNCFNDDIYIYEYNNICYKEFPENTYILEGDKNNKYFDKLNLTNLLDIINSIKENNNLNFKFD